MNVGLLLITHGHIGHALLRTATAMLGGCPMPALAIAVHQNCDPDAVLKDAHNACRRVDKGDGVLVLTDLFGSTPSNIANRLHESHSIVIVSGVNVPMLVRVLNYSDLDLLQLGEKAISGGRDGVMLCAQEAFK
jgi:PTS system mannose-specific IIA component